jgi:tetratricopeptide (TPR) repeat protein
MLTATDGVLLRRLIRLAALALDKRDAHLAATTIAAPTPPPTQFLAMTLAAGRLPRAFHQFELCWRPTMLKFAVSFLCTLLLISGSALAAGSEPATTQSAPAPEPVTIAPAEPSAIATTTVTTTAPSVNWTERWGDLGPGFKAAKQLIEAEQYVEAIAALEALNKPEDPRVLNWLGFSNRKLGNTDEAILLYTRALTIAPDFTPAHEYLGEAYIQGNDIPKAQAQLATIEQLCGNQSCKEYKLLKRSLDKAARTSEASASIKGSSSSR